MPWCAEPAQDQASRPVRTPPTGPNQRWSMDFVSDSSSSGRRFRCLNIFDEFNRESVAQHAARSIPAVRVIEILERLRQDRGLPEAIVTDSSSEFTSHAFDARAYARGIRHELMHPGKPVQNCFVESFNGTFRDDCLNLHWFTASSPRDPAPASIEDAAPTIEAWRRDYNEVRPHSSLDWLTPSEYGTLHQQREEALAINPDLPL